MKLNVIFYKVQGDTYFRLQTKKLVNADSVKPYLVILENIKPLTKVMRASKALTSDEIRALITEQTQYYPAFSGLTEEGHVVGRLIFGDEGCNYVDCRDRSMIISSKIDKVYDMKTDALFILLVDNDITYHRLYEDRFYNRYPCIIVKVIGRHDVSTWLFVWKLKIDL